MISCLLIEDDPGDAKLAVRALNGGYDCRIASSLENALAEIAREIPEVIVTDIKLPDVALGSAVSLVAKLRAASGPDTTIVVHSGAQVENLAESLTEAGADGLCSKGGNLALVTLASRCRNRRYVRLMHEYWGSRRLLLEEDVERLITLLEADLSRKSEIKGWISSVRENVPNLDPKKTAAVIAAVVSGLLAWLANQQITK